MFSFTTPQVRLQLLDGPPFPQDFDSHTLLVSVSYNATPKVTPWGIDGWHLAPCGNVTFSATPIDAVTGANLPPITHTVDISKVPATWDKAPHPEHILRCTGLALSFDRQGNFSPQASVATFSS
jgi:hypothetical protein